MEPPLHDPEMIAPLQARVLADRIYVSLREAILSLEIAPGAPLVERDLSERFGVSKSPVRDALQRLAGEGLATYTANRGIAAREISAREAGDLQQVREVLEELAVRLAVPRLSSVDLQRLRRALEQSETAMGAQDLAQLAKANREFHDTFANRCGNELLQQTLSTMRDRLRTLALLEWQKRPSMEPAHREHQDLLAAAEARDVRKAASIIRRHIRRHGS